MDILAGLNPQQKQAVTHTGSPLLVLAGAGSGKTKVLTHRAAYLVDQKIANSSEILLLTFTNKAAGEMKERMAKLLTTTNRNSLFAGTFHSFCCYILRRSGQSIGISPNFTIYDTDDQENLLRTVINDLGFTPKEFKPSSVAYFIENAKNNFLDPDSAATTAHGFWETYAAKIYQQYQRKLTEYHALDFNDLLFMTVRLFSDHPSVLEKYQQQYRHVLVDEYQDTNQIQYLLTKLLARKYRQISAVGDASQSIYGWRGADYHNLVAFTSDFKDARVINLEENYRSTQTILDAANSVIVKNNSHPVLKLFTTKQSSNLIKLIETESEIAEAKNIAQEITSLHHHLHLAWKDIAVLYRMNAQSRVIEEAFLKNNIPYVLIGGLRFYDRSEVKDILAMLRLANNPVDELSSGRCLKALGKNRRQLFDSCLKTIDVKKLTSLEILETLITTSGYLDKFDSKDEDDQRRLENIKELKSVAATFPHLNDFLENVALVQAEYSQQEKTKGKENREGVRLMTLHSSKGLEFTAVFLVGFEEGILPHSQSMVDEHGVEEERRLCYVGITRAKDFLFISYATRRLYFGRSSLNEPSRFLADIPRDLLEFISPAEVTRHYRHRQPSDSDFIYDPDIY